MTTEPFVLHVEQAILDDLHRRLAQTRWPDEPAAAPWSLGTDTRYLKALVDDWLHAYDWRAHEAAVNAWPQFLATVEGHRLHFVHARAKQRAMPLVLIHGWPDNFYRYHRVIPMLVDTFDVVVPSLPGYGFSDRRSTSATTAADLIVKLVTDELGYPDMFVAGGDQGALVAKAMAERHPRRVRAVHLTDVGYPTGQEDPAKLSESEREFATFIQRWWMTEGAYAMLHATKPQTLAHALADSPVGLAAWMCSFIDIGADQHDLDGAVGGRDHLLTMIMINWVSERIGSAMRMYQLDAAERYARPSATEAPPPRGAPAAVAVFPREAPVPEAWARRQVNVQRFTKLRAGGHFAALEVPELYVEDLRASFAPYRDA